MFKYKNLISTKEILLTTFFIIFILFIEIDARTRKPKEKKPKKIYNPRDKKPLRLSD